MHTHTLIRITGITLALIGAGVLLLEWLGLQETLRASGNGPDMYLKFYFLGEAISWANVEFHDTYYLVANPVWSWLALFACVVGTVMAVRPDWLSNSRDGRE